MNVFVKLWEDVTKLWSRYAGLYLNGVWNTISLAVICTAVGCIIGLFCGRAFLRPPGCAGGAPQAA